MPHAGKWTRFRSSRRWWENLTPPDDDAQYDTAMDALFEDRKIERERHRKGWRDDE